MKIKNIHASEILDSRGNPTVEVKIELINGVIAKASVPSGASTGVHEALELRDNDKRRFLGRGVLKAVKNVNQIIAPKLKGWAVLDQVKIDRLMIILDGTANKKNLGANAILGVSMAVARAAAMSLKMPLYKYICQTYRLKNKAWRMPQPTMNIINGGKHADNLLTIQEFMIVPRGSSFEKKYRVAAEVFQNLKNLLHQAGKSIAVGDEGGFVPNFKRPEKALDFIVEAIKIAGYKPGDDCDIALDLAMSEFYDEQKQIYKFYNKNQKSGISAAKLIKILDLWLKKYPIVSIEDPLAQDDWFNWSLLTGFLGEQVTIVGDDLFVTNTTRLSMGIERHVANAILIKLNQIGTLTETIDTINLAKKNGYKISVSHRSGETDDTFIADLAVATNADFLKSGSLSRMERIAKYNRVLEIERELKNS